MKRINDSTALALVAAILAFVSMACGGAHGEEARPASETAASADDEVKLSSSVKAFVESVASEYTRPLVDDGVVTFAEYEKSLFAMLQCLGEAGVYPDQPPVLDASRHYSYGLVIPSNDKDQADKAIASCRSYYFEAVQRAWGTYKPPGFDELLAQARDTVGSCASNAGIEVERPVSHAEMVELLRKEDPRFLTCVSQAQQSFKLYGILP